MLRKMCQESPRDWDRYLHAVLFAYREVPQASTRFSPFELLYGCTIRGPMQVLKELWTKEDTPEVKNTYQYVLDLRNRMEDTFKNARESLHQAQGQHKHHYDKKSKRREFKVGDKVTVLLPTYTNKLLLQWKGPYEVTDVVNKLDYKVQVNGKAKVYHANLLHRFYRGRGPENKGKVETGAIGIAVIQPETDKPIKVVDDENLLNMGKLKCTEKYKDVRISKDLTAKQRRQVIELLEEYQDIYPERPGTTDLGEHRKELTTADPIRTKPYVMPYSKGKEVEEEVQKMLEMGVTEPSNSPYNSPIVVVKKKDNTNRFCIDFQRINAATKFDSEPMANSKDILAKLQKDQYFTKIDFSKGYWQIPMAKESKPVTAFSTTNGCYQFCKMPFRLMNAVVSFNRTMRKLLADVKDAEANVDDVIEHTVTWDAHIANLRVLFGKIREVGLTILP